ncbi:MAG: hypothetical protein QOJ63_1831, partial [Solirubrobacteraceae bacterium]|nr:hypothetical protein [Solirubrobacteraceae bacterium]
MSAGRARAPALIALAGTAIAIAIAASFGAS